MNSPNPNIETKEIEKDLGVWVTLIIDKSTGLVVAEIPYPSRYEIYGVPQNTGGYIVG